MNDLLFWQTPADGCDNKPNESKSMDEQTGQESTKGEKEKQ